MRQSAHINLLSNVRTAFITTISKSGRKEKKKAILGIAVALLAGCAAKSAVMYSKTGLNEADYKRDSYECMQQSKTSWAGGGSGLLGLAMVAGSSQSAQDTANKTFNMCMEARGYSGHVLREGEQAARTRANDYCASVFKSLAMDPIRPRTFLPPVMSSTPSMLADGSKMTTELQPAVLEWGRLRQQCLDRQIQELASISYPTQLMSLTKAVNTLGSVNIIRLYRGDITWGEANQRRQELTTEGSRLLSKISALLTEGTQEAVQRANQLVLDEQQDAANRVSMAIALPPSQATCQSIQFGDLTFPYCR